MATSIPQGTYIVSPNPGDFGGGAVPLGTVLSYAGPTAPDGWLLCRGQAVSRAQYASLFAVISTIYGGGDGSTTFNVPNLEGRLIRGSGASSWQLATTGGSDAVVLQPNQLAPHAHATIRGGVRAVADGSGDFLGNPNVDSGGLDQGAIFAANIGPTGARPAPIVDQTGTGQQPVAVTNSYIALGYIIRAI